jgi:hypothetical protein
MSKFSGQCELEITDDYKEFDDAIIIGDTPTINDQIDFFDLELILKGDKKFESLVNGCYHVYFTGTIEWIKSYNYENGVDDYDPELEITQVSFWKFDFK